MIATKIASSSKIRQTIAQLDGKIEQLERDRVALQDAIAQRSENFEGLGPVQKAAALDAQQKDLDSLRDLDAELTRCRGDRPELEQRFDKAIAHETSQVGLERLKLREELNSLKEAYSTALPEAEELREKINAISDDLAKSYRKWVGMAMALNATAAKAAEMEMALGLGDGDADATKPTYLRPHPQMPSLKLPQIGEPRGLVFLQRGEETIYLSPKCQVDFLDISSRAPAPAPAIPPEENQG